MQNNKLTYFLTLLTVTAITVTQCFTDSFVTKAENALSEFDFTCDSEVSYSASAGQISKLYGKAAVTSDDTVFIPNGSSAEFAISVSQTGSYVYAMKYMTETGTGGSIEISLSIDGEEKSGVASYTFPRLYSQGEINTEKGKDDSQPEVEELSVWQEYYAYDNTGYSNEPYTFEIATGVHTVRIEAIRGGLYIKKLSFESFTEPNDYISYSTLHSDKTEVSASKTVQAENFLYKNDTTVIPKSDSTSAETQLQSAFVRRLNTVGGSSWKTARSAVTWEVDIPESGIYYIHMRYRQNVKDGIFSSRKLYIDGAVPFSEAQAIRFEGGSNWQEKTFGNENGEYGFYLTKGEHLITLEVVVGDMAESFSEINDLMAELNDIYREIIMVTGSSPDIYRDYSFEKLIPQELTRLEEIGNRLNELEKQIIELSEADDGYTAILEKLSYQILEMTSNPRIIAKQLSRFKSNLGSLASWLLEGVEQPLQIDWICFDGEKDYQGKRKGFFASVGFGIQRLFASFVKDYNSVGADEQSTATTLKIWMQTGRDQAEVLRELIDTRFCKDYNAAVQLQVVGAGTLLPSVLAGTGPDIMLNNASGDPINYAIRNAVTDLTEFDDFEEFSENFFDAAVEPFRFNGSVYALPETFSFPMFFYRTDIFEKYDWEVPQTLSDMKILASELQAKGMNMSFPVGVTGYGTVLYQNGGSFYVGEGEATSLDSEVGLSSFEEYMKLYTLYTLPALYSFVNRFRTGEMPCGVEDYTIYNTLAVYAPEIVGLWKMVPIPGIEKSDGTIDRSTVGTSVGTMIIKSSKNHQLSWEFVKWWLSEDIQSTYGRNLESLLGSAAKYNTANRTALQKMTWSYQEYTALTEQAEWTRAIPEVPGGYYLARTVTFAFNRVYNANTEQSVAEDPTEVIKDYISEINSELERKRKEFGL